MTYLWHFIIEIYTRSNGKTDKKAKTNGNLVDFFLSFVVVLLSKETKFKYVGVIFVTSNRTIVRNSEKKIVNKIKDKTRRQLLKKRKKKKTQNDNISSELIVFST